MAAPGHDDQQTRRGRRLGIDVGSVRIASRCAIPTHTRHPGRDRATGHVRRVGCDENRRTCRRIRVVGVVIGLPKTLRNTDGVAVAAAREFGDALTSAIAPVLVEYVDERLTTVTAAQALRASGRSAKASRSVIDQAAAVAILQGWLDARR